MRVHDYITGNNEAVTLCSDCAEHGEHMVGSPISPERDGVCDACLGDDY